MLLGLRRESAESVVHRRLMLLGPRREPAESVVHLIGVLGVHISVVLTEVR